MQVPVIDLTLPEEEAAEAVRVACTDYGFFYVKNHGVPETLVQDAFGEACKFFALPLEEKMKIHAVSNRGFTPMQEQTLDPKTQSEGDTKEGLYFGRDVDPDSEDAKLPLSGPNLWPSQGVLSDFRAVCLHYIDTLTGVAFKVWRLIALSLGLPADWFAKRADRAMPLLRFVHYNERKSDPVKGLLGAGAHTDWGCMTLLRTDENPGLQIHLNEEWLDVPPIPDTFIINLGDMLERLTNGMYRSTLHRVVSTGGRERYSIPFFIDPNFDTPFEPLPQCCTPERPAQYAPTTVGEHLLAKYAQTHADFHTEEFPNGAASA